MPASLQQRFAINNALPFEDRPGGLTRAIISTESAEAELYLHALMSRIGMLHGAATIRAAQGGKRPHVRAQIEVNPHALH
jgi:hypothetical protein